MFSQSILKECPPGAAHGFVQKSGHSVGAVAIYNRTQHKTVLAQGADMPARGRVQRIEDSGFIGSKIHGDRPGVRTVARAPTEAKLRCDFSGRIPGHMVS